MVTQNRNINLLLGFVAFALAIAIVASIMKPMSFKTTVSNREMVVIERMKIVRTAAARFRQDNDRVFCSTIDSLVICGYLADSLKYIPFSDGKVFFFEGSYTDYEANKAKRLGIEEPKRQRYRKLDE